MDRERRAERGDRDEAAGQRPQDTLAEPGTDSARRASARQLQELGGERTGGEPLPARLQRTYEGELGADLTGVRVHTGSGSQTAAAAIDARAFTVGRDIHFAPGQYDPGSSGGRQLLAHEVAHVAQQAQAGPAVQAKSDSAPVTPSEAKADGTAAALGKATDDPSALIAADVALLGAVLVAAELEDGHLGAADAATCTRTLRRWQDAGHLAELIAGLRAKKSGHPMAKLLGMTLWQHMTWALDDTGRRRMYDILAEGNVAAGNMGRLTEDLEEFWSIQMNGDVAIVESSLKTLQESSGTFGKPVDAALAQARIIDRFQKYLELDRRYGMKNSLFNNFVLKVEFVTYKEEGVFVDTLRTLLDQIKRDMSPAALEKLDALLAKSDLAFAKEGPSEDPGLDDAVIETLIEGVESAADVLGIIASYGDAVAKKVMRKLATYKPDSVGDFIVKYFELHRDLVGFAVTLIGADTLGKLIKSIDVKRLASFMAAMALTPYLVLISPQLFAAYKLLPEETRKLVFSALDAVALEPIIRECKAHVVPILKGMIGDVMPVGMGFKLAGGLGITHVSASVGVGKEFILLRDSADTFKYSEKVEDRAGAEAGVGGGINLGSVKKGAKEDGSDDLSWGAEGAAGWSAGVKMTDSAEYRFDVTSDDAFIGFLVAVAGIGDLVALEACLYDSLEDVDLDQWLQTRSFSMKGYGEGDMRADAGLRTGSALGEGETTSWDHMSGKSDKVGSSPKMGFNDPFLAKIAGASASAVVRHFVEAGGGVEMTRHEKLSIPRTEETPGQNAFEVSLFAEASRLLDVAVSIPFLPPVLALLPATGLRESGAGVSYKFVVVMPEGEMPYCPPDLQPRVGLKLTAGEGNSVELNLNLPGEGGLDGVEGFKKLIDGATIKKRFGLTTMIGKNYKERMERSASFQSALSAASSGAGVNLAGWLDAEFQLGAADAVVLFELASAVIGKASDRTLQQLAGDVLTFFSTGKLPAWMADDSARIRDILARALKKLNFHAEVGGGYAAGARAEAGVAERISGHGSAAVIYEVDARPHLGELDFDTLRGTLAAITGD